MFCERGYFSYFGRAFCVAKNLSDCPFVGSFTTLLPWEQYNVPKCHKRPLPDVLRADDISIARVIAGDTADHF
jgi:hypothetical protein